MCLGENNVVDGKYGPYTGERLLLILSLQTENRFEKTRRKNK